MFSQRWGTATWLYIAPLGDMVGPFVLRHQWIIGVVAAVVGFAPVTGIWLVARRLFTGVTSATAA